MKTKKEILMGHDRSSYAKDNGVLNAMEEYANQFKSVISEYQLCPKCNGQGLVSRPPYIAGDISEWTGSTIANVCDVCAGAKVLIKPIVQQ